MITTRVATDDDKGFLWALKKAAMSEYVSAVYGWDDEIQYSFFEKGFNPSALQIIEEEGQMIGMYELNDRGDDFYLARIEILPEKQGHGIGTRLLQGMVNGAAKMRKPIRLQVFKVNPARYLYQRLGFSVTGKTEHHIQMEHAQQGRQADASGAGYL